MATYLGGTLSDKNLIPDTTEPPMAKENIYYINNINK